MGKVHIHIHKRTADASETKQELAQRIDRLEKQIETMEKAAKTRTMTRVQAAALADEIRAEWRKWEELTARMKRTADAAEPQASEKQALIRDFLIKTDSKDRDVALQYLRAKSWDLDRAVQGWERLNSTADAKPATDSERRERIQRVMQGAGVTEATARNMLEGEEWDVIDAIRELKHMRSIGFVIDAKPTYDAASSAKEDELDRQIREKVKTLGGHVSVQVPGLHRKPVQQELLALAEKYKKLTGQMHRSFENYYG